MNRLIFFLFDLNREAQAEGYGWIGERLFYTLDRKHFTEKIINLKGERERRFKHFICLR